MLENGIYATYKERGKHVRTDTKVKRDDVSKLIEEQDKIYKHYKFYDEYLKAINKEKRK